MRSEAEREQWLYDSVIYYKYYVIYHFVTLVSVCESWKLARVIYCYYYIFLYMNVQGYFSKAMNEGYS